MSALLGQETGLAGWGVMSGEQRVKASSFFLCQGEKKPEIERAAKGSCFAGQARGPCRAAGASRLLSHLERGGLDVEATVEFVPGLEGS